ncbi:hypothetical protein HGRIS_002345 [Hohenbuehelia grisea]|uniref:N-alpha-acetyltransferase 60 n=1 Tax=Hohenbuehelia grisea TaxID=104357 RepID=A0ABR3JM92_9AGAR
MSYVDADLDDQFDEDNIALKSLTSADVQPVRALHSALLPVRYPTSFFIHLLVHSSSICLVARASTSNAPIAFISAAIQHNASPSAGLAPNAAHDESTGVHVQILTLGVLPKYRNRGLAQRLVRTAVSRLIDSSVPAGITQVPAPPPARTGAPSTTRGKPDGALVSAHVSTSNARAIEFYKRIGLAPSLEIRDLYRGVSSGSRDAHLVVGYISLSDKIEP